MRIFKKSNKGVALITIMITVAFLSIICTSLLAMSYNNYRLKVVNQNSKKNFYEAEKDLNIISAKVRSSVAGSTTPEDTLKSTLGVTGSNYSALKLAQIVNTSASGNASSASYFVTNPDGTKDKFIISAGGTYTKIDGDASSTDDVPSGLTKIKISGIAIRQQSNYNTSTNEFDYDNQIKTDIDCWYEETTAGGGGGGVGDFSFLSDSALAVKPASNKGTTLSIYGNAYFADYVHPSGKTTVAQPGGGTADYWITEPGSNAFSLNQYGRVSCFGDVVISYGTINLSKDAVLVIDADAFYCYGDINLYDTSSLLCTGKLYMPNGKNVICHSEATKKNVYPSTLVSTATNPSNVTRLTDDQVVNFKKKIGCYDDGASYTTAANAKKNDGVLPQICQAAAKVGSTTKNFTWYLDTTSGNPANPSNTYTAADGFTYGIIVRHQTPINAGDLKYALCFMCAKHDTYLVRDKNINSTILSNQKIEFDMEHDIVLTKMGGEAFNSLAEIKKPTKSIKVQFTDDKYYIQDVFVEDPDAAINAIISAASGGGTATTPAQTSVGYVNWTKDKDLH